MPQWLKVYHVEGGFPKHKPLNLKHVLHKNISWKCLRDDEGGDIRTLIVWHSDVNWHGVSRRIGLKKKEPLDLMYDF